MDIQQQPPSRIGSSTPSAHRKRQKVSVACEPCRRKKMKCDAIRPTCGACKRSPEKVECTFASGRPDSKDTTARFIPYAPSQSIGAGSKMVQSFPSGDLAPHSHVEANETALPPDTLPPGTAAHDMYGHSLPQPNAVLSVDSMNGVMGDPAHTREMFGSSSAGSFMRQIQAAMNAKTGIHSFPASASQIDPTKKRSSTPLHSSHEQAALSVLPPRGLADQLIQAYWEFEWSLFPIVNKREIDTFYQSLWLSSNSEFCLLSMGIINICFALACHYCNFLPPQERGPMGYDFYLRAEQCRQKSRHDPELERVQLLLLLGVYLQSTDDTFKCWMTVGEAIRIAQSLGICFDHGPPSESIAYQENKRRTWHACIWLDRVLSATLGRPGMIPKWLFGSVPLPLMIDDEYFEIQETSSGTRPDGQPCVMAFSVKAFELYQILDDVLVNLYLEPIQQKEFDHKLAHLLEIDKKILIWKESLPKYLEYPPTSKYGATVARQATILRIRLLHVRILLLRPALVGYLNNIAPLKSDNNPADVSISSVMLLESGHLCFRLAHELVNIFKTKLCVEDMTGSLPSWWYSVLYVYTAATVILVERFLEAQVVTTEKSKAHRIWDDAIHVLTIYTPVAVSAKKCMAALEVLSQNLLPGDESSQVATNGRAGVLDPETLSEMRRFLGEQSSVLPFSIDDFMWLG